MSGRLIVIEGLDGSGKSTQLELLSKRLDGNFRFVKFPDYPSESSALVRMYLAGEFGSHPEDVNAYAASSFYAVDRYASFKRDWGADYLGGTDILCDRYTTSNAVHQASKLSGDERDRFLDWLCDFEFGKLGIPRPDAVIFLDMPVEVSQRLMTGRYSGDEGRKDIHERDIAYLQHCREGALYAAKRLGWSVVKCTDGDRIRSREDISDEIFSIISKIM